MEPYQQRVIDEQEELESKLQKLNEFLDSGAMVSATEQENLLKQSRIMTEYFEILQKRIEWFNA